MLFYILLTKKKRTNKVKTRHIIHIGIKNN